MFMRRLSFALISLVLTLLANSTVRAEALCEENGDVRIWVSPLNPRSDAPFKIMAVGTDGGISELSIRDDQGREMDLSLRFRGGPPWSAQSDTEGLAEGDYQIIAKRQSNLVACRTLSIGGRNPVNTGQGWGLASEAFYSAWIEELFGAPHSENLSFASLEPVLRNSERNFLHNFLGMNEDKALPLTPDCADLPYTLRAYFAWKVGLPIAYRACSRGSANAPPRCGGATLKTEFTHGPGSQGSFRNISGLLVNAVHSGSARTGLEDEATDLYPVPLRRDTLWPGTVYADPYGHVLMLVEWVPGTNGKPGMLLAVDAQPDNSITRKRVWEGTFLYANVRSAGPGFKAFRPIVKTGEGGFRTLSNDELAEHPGFAPYSLEQADLTPDTFYAKLAKLINPQGLDPRQAYDATLDALVEQVETRVTSIDNGENYFHKNPDAVIAMPSGAAIFETIGPWEDYATPSRDMRLIIAMNVLQGLPDKIVRHPDLFLLGGVSPMEAKNEITDYAARRVKERSIRYNRTDGSTWELSIADILARKSLYEMTYNPNDCAEARWGATPGSAEYSPCRRHAPAEQLAKMEQYRAWFRDAKRPTR